MKLNVTRSFIKMSLAALVLIIGVFLADAQMAEKGSGKTITLPNGEVVYDLNGEWNASVENYGLWSQYGSYPQIMKITQEGSSFVGVRMIDDPWNSKGSQSLRGDLDKSGFKKVQIISAAGPLDAKGQISEDGNKMIIDASDKARVTLTRK